MMAKWTKVNVGRWERQGAYVRQLQDGDWRAETDDCRHWAYVATAQEGMDYIDSVLDGDKAIDDAFGKEPDFETDAATMAEGPSHPLPGYASLYAVLCDAYRQAATGKGKDRHTDGGGVPFEQQPIMTITREQGLGFPLGQTMKKALEANRMADKGQHHAAEAELLGAIVYTAAAVLRLRELAGEDDDFEDVKIGGSG